MSKFKVGDKVVCKRSTGEVHDYLIPDAVYTVTGTISDLIHIEGQPSEHCLERIKQGLLHMKVGNSVGKLVGFNSIP